MKVFRKAVIIFVILALPLLTNVANASSGQAVVTASNLNVREAPDLSSRIIGVVHLGDTFPVIQIKDGWKKIQLSGRQTGWVYNDYIAPAGHLEATVKAAVLNVRKAPGISSRIVAGLKAGTKVTIDGEHAGWAKIAASSGVKGWVYEAYIVKTDAGSQPVPEERDKQNAPPSGDVNNRDHVNKTLPSGDPNARRTLHNENKTSPSTDKNIRGPLHHETKTLPSGDTNAREPLKGKTIVLDPGHGGKDGGTKSITGVPEKNLTLATAKAVEQKLESAGANVIMTRTDDTYIPLHERAKISNENDADAFISFHYNWSGNPSANGLIDFYYHKSKDDPLASDILTEVSKATGLSSIGTRFDDLGVLRDNSQPSTLIELGFLSNQQDVAVVESSTYCDQVAQGVYLGLLDYFAMK